MGKDKKFFSKEEAPEVSEDTKTEEKPVKKVSKKDEKLVMKQVGTDDFGNPTFKAVPESEL